MLSEKLKALKTEKNLTTHQLSELSGLPESTISRILSGQTDSPGFLAVVDLVRAMGGSLDEIVGIETPEAPKAPEAVKVQKAPEAPEVQKAPEKSEVPSDYREIIKLYERSIAAKNAWIRKLAITCCVLVGLIVCLTLLDVLNGSVGYVRY